MTPDRVVCARAGVHSNKTGITRLIHFNLSFLFNKEIKFSHIPLLINKALDKVENNFSPDLGTIFECDRQTREYVMSLT